MIVDVTKKKWHIRHVDEIWTIDENVDNEEYVTIADTPEIAKYLVDLHNSKLDNTPTKITSLDDVLKVGDIVTFYDEEQTALIIFGVKSTKIRVGWHIENGSREQQVDFTIAGKSIPINGPMPAYIAPLDENGEVLITLSGKIMTHLFQDGEIKVDRIEATLQRS